MYDIIQVPVAAADYIHPGLLFGSIVRGVEQSVINDKKRYASSIVAYEAYQLSSFALLGYEFCQRRTQLNANGLSQLLKLLSFGLSILLSRLQCGFDFSSLVFC